MALRYALWYAAFGHLGLGGAFRLYAFYVAVGGTYIFTNFAVSHTHKDVVPHDKHISWTLYSANHTTNQSNTPLVNWWMAYLNFQIEHHLFPEIPRRNLRKISARVQAFCKRHDLPYRTHHSHR